MSIHTLIKTKTITVKSYIDGEQEHKIIISRYPATEAIKNVHLVSGVIKNIVNPSSFEQADHAQKVAIEIVRKYCGVVSDTEGDIRLDNDAYINAYIPDAETLFKVVKEVHDYNTNFLSSGNLSQEFRSLLANIKSSAMQTLTKSAAQFKLKD